MTDRALAAEVDVVILTWNDGPLLARAIASCQGSLGVVVNVIVVDNGSDPPAEVPDGVTLLRNERNVGVAAGRNQGIAAGRADVVCLLDSDAELSPGALRRLVDELVATGAGLVVPVFAGQAPEASAGRAPDLARKLSRMAGRTATYEPSPHPVTAMDGGSWPVEFGIGACQVFHRHWWEAAGGIDEAFFYGPEDVDFCLRLLDLGAEIRQVAGAPVIHPARRRHRRPVDLAGLRHGTAVLRYAIRHRRRLSRTPSPAQRRAALVRSLGSARRPFGSAPLGSARRVGSAARRLGPAQPGRSGPGSEAPDRRGAAQWYVVVGPGRSGSTVLDRLLGDRGVVTVGELAHVWQRVGAENQLCGCGHPARTCPFWSGVLTDALGPDWVERCAALENLRQRVATYRAWPGSVIAPRRWRAEAAELIDATDALATAIEARVGPAVVWDASKSAMQARLLAEAGRDPAIVVLTRHPAAVAFSWGRPKPRPEADGRPMPRHGVVGSSLRWSFTVVSGLIEARRRRTVVEDLRYRDLGHLLATGWMPAAMPTKPPAQHSTPTNRSAERWVHAIGGNPVRWANGPDRPAPAFAPDDRWRTTMRRSSRLAATAIAGPGLAALVVARRLGWSRPVGPEPTMDRWSLVRRQDRFPTPPGPTSSRTATGG